MEPLTLIMGALVEGAIATIGKDVAVQTIKTGYTKLRDMIIRRFGSKVDVKESLQHMEKKPASEARQKGLKEELEAAGVDKDDEIKEQARELLDLLKKEGLIPSTSYSARLTGSGSIAQGPGATAAGEGGIAIGGNVQGDLRITGRSNMTGKKMDSGGEDA